MHALVEHEPGRVAFPGVLAVAGEVVAVIRGLHLGVVVHRVLLGRVGEPEPDARGEVREGEEQEAEDGELDPAYSGES